MAGLFYFAFRNRVVRNSAAVSFRVHHLYFYETSLRSRGALTKNSHDAGGGGRKGSAMFTVVSNASGFPNSIRNFAPGFSLACCSPTTCSQVPVAFYVCDMEAADLA